MVEYAKNVNINIHNSVEDGMLMAADTAQPITYVLTGPA